MQFANLQEIFFLLIIIHLIIRIKYYWYSKHKLMEIKYYFLLYLSNRWLERNLDKDMYINPLNKFRSKWKNYIKLWAKKLCNQILIKLVEYIFKLGIWVLILLKIIKRSLLCKNHFILLESHLFIIILQNSDLIYVHIYIYIIFLCVNMLLYIYISLNKSTKILWKIIWYWLGVYMNKWCKNLYYSKQ